MPPRVVGREGEDYLVEFNPGEAPTRMPAEMAETANPGLEIPSQFRYTHKADPIERPEGQPTGPVNMPAMPNRVVIGGSASQGGSVAVSGSGYPGVPKAPSVDYGPQIKKAEEIRGNIEATGQAAEGVARMGAAAQQAAADELYAQQQAHAARQRAMADQERDYLVTADQVIQQKHADIQQRMAAVPQVDPGKIWRDRSEFQNAASIVSAFMGGMLAVSTGSGRNLGLEALERQIDRSIEAQRANIENEWRKIGVDREDLADMRASYRARESEQRAMMKESMASYLASEVTKYNSVGKQAELQNQVMSIRQSAAKDVMAANNAVASLVQAQTAQRLDRWKAEGNFRHQSFMAKLAADRAAAEAGALKTATNWNVSRVNGIYQNQVVNGQKVRGQYVARNEAEFNKLQELGNNRVGKQNALRQIRLFYQHGEPSTWSADKRAEFGALLSNSILSGGEKLGRLSDKDLELIKTAIGGNPQEFSSFLQSYGVSQKIVERALENNRATYSREVKAVDESLDVELPGLDKAVEAGLKPPEARERDIIGESTARVEAAAADGDREKLSETMEQLDTNLFRGDANKNMSPKDIEDLRNLYSRLEQMKPEQRRMIDSKGRNVDALTVMKSILGAAQSVKLVQGVPFIDQGAAAQSGAQEYLDEVNPQNDVLRGLPGYDEAIKAINARKPYGE